MNINIHVCALIIWWLVYTGSQWPSWAVHVL